MYIFFEKKYENRKNDIKMKEKNTETLSLKTKITKINK